MADESQGESGGHRLQTTIDEHGAHVTDLVALPHPQVLLRPSGPSPVAYSDIDHTISEETLKRLLSAGAENTQAAYMRAWEQFAGWCQVTGRVFVPATAHTLTEYVRLLCDSASAPATIAQAISTVRSKHTDAGYRGEPDNKEPLKLLKQYRRRWVDEGNREKQATPIMVDALKAMVGTCDTATLSGVRDRALLLVGFNMMARRSELVGLDYGDDVEGESGLTVYVKRSKTDQEARGVTVAIPYGQNPETCAVRAVRAWKVRLAERGLLDGPLFRPIDRHGRVGGEPEVAGHAAARLTGKSANDIVHRRGVLAGLSEYYTAHGLRAGAATTAYAAGVPVAEIARHGRWSPRSPVLFTYFRAVDQWKNNPMQRIGL